MADQRKKEREEKRAAEKARRASETILRKRKQAITKLCARALSKTARPLVDLDNIISDTHFRDVPKHMRKESEALQKTIAAIERDAKTHMHGAELPPFTDQTLDDAVKRADESISSLFGLLQRIS